MRRLAVIVVAVALVAFGASEAAPPARGDDGAALVYLEPFSQDAAGLEFRLDSLSAVSEDGTRTPLSVRLSELKGREITRQRRLASAPLPPGRYAGLELGVSSATLAGEAGRAALLAPNERVSVPLPFGIEKRQGVVLTLRLDYRGSLDSEFRFAPSFLAQIAPRPAAATLALASSPDIDLLVLYDKVSGSVAGVVPMPTGSSPRGLALDERRRLAYVALTADDTVTALGLLEPRTQGALRLRGGDQPRELALTPDGATLLSANYGSQTVSLIDPLAMVELDRLPVGERPGTVLVDATGVRAYVCNTASSNVTVLDLGSRTVVATIATEGEPFRAVLDRTGDQLFVVHRRSPFLTVIDTTDLVVARRVFVGSGVTALAIDPRTDLVYLGSKDAGVIEVYDPLSLLPVDSIAVEGEVSFLAIDGEGNNLHVALPGLGELRVVRLAGKKTVARVDLGEALYWVTFFGQG